MSIESTLQRIEEEIRLGKLGKARDRLHGLLSNDPKNLLIREKLGNIYWKLQMPELAGKYWYLIENKTIEMVEASRSFERRYGNDPMQILFALKYKSDDESNKYINGILSNLHQKAKEQYNWYEDYRKRGGYKFRYYNPSNHKKTNNKLFTLGCLSIILLILIFSIFGIYYIIQLLT
jgi:hypothetical protein